MEDQIITAALGILASLETFRGAKWTHKKLFVDRVPRTELEYKKKDSEFWKKEWESRGTVIDQLSLLIGQLEKQLKNTKTK
jgi:hypothetical protein